MRLELNDKTEVNVDRINDSLSDGSHQLTVNMIGLSVEAVEEKFTGKTETLVVKKEDGTEAVFKGYSEVVSINRDISENEDIVRITLKKA